MCMAGEVGHVVYAARMLTYLDDKVSDSSYWAGTLFPDIRHLGVISRHSTHPSDISLKSLEGKNDFHTGMRVHTWIDATREKFLRDNNVKERLPWHPFVPHALKLMEDELLYNRFDDWNLIQRTLNKVYEDELFYVDSQEKIVEWHRILQDYFKEKPNDETRLALATAIGITETSARELNTVVAELSRDSRAGDLLYEFLSYLERLLR